MPAALNACIHALTIMIGEKAAAMIAENVMDRRRQAVAPAVDDQAANRPRETRQLEAERPQPVTRFGIIGLRVRASIPQSVKVEPALRRPATWRG